MKRPAPPKSQNKRFLLKGGRNGEEIWRKEGLLKNKKKHILLQEKKNGSFSMLCQFLFISNYILMTQQFFGPLYKIHGRFGDLGLKVKMHS